MTLPSRWLVLKARLAPSHAATYPDPEDFTAQLAQGLTDLGGRAVHEDESGWQITHLAEGAVPVEFGDAADRWHGRLAAESGIAPPHLELETEWQEHGDWAELWKRGLEPRRLTERIVVTPSWCAPTVQPGDLVLTVDPGMAFGNAEHGTTRGCLRLLDRLVQPGVRLLDVGAGSAILAIAAARLGATSVLAIEMDELAIPTARENVEVNGVEAQVRVEQQKVDSADLAALGEYDGVIANIEAGFLRPLLDGFARAVAPAGWLLLSGILALEEADMRADTEAHGFDWVETDADGEWRSMLFRRHEMSRSASS